MASITTKKANRLFHVFHLSYKLLDDEAFEFTPRIPRHPYYADGGIIEDDFTERISLAPTIEKAVEALTVSPTYYHVYAGDLVSDPDDDIPTIQISKIKLTLPKYGPDFELQRWLTKIYDSPKTNEDLKKQLELCIRDKNAAECPRRPSHLPEPLKQQFKYAVPDAKQTKEEWAVQPIRLLYLGQLDGNVVELSEAATKFLKSKGLVKPWQF